MKIQKASERQFKQLFSSRTNEQYSQSHVISEALETKEIFLSIEVLRPRSCSSAPHFHLETDEIVYVLRGEVVAIEGDTEVTLQEGDCALFQAGSNRPHVLQNRSEEREAHVLVIRKPTQTNDAVFATP